MTSQAEHPTFSIDDEDVQDAVLIPAAPSPLETTVIATAEGTAVPEPHTYVPVDDKICAELAEERAKEAATASKPHALDVIKEQVSALKQTAGTTVHSWGERMYAYMEKRDVPLPDTPPTSEPLAADTNSGPTRGAKILAAAADLGKKSRENAAWVVHTAAEGIKRFSLPSRTLRGICRHEASSRPVPQSVLLLCSAIISATPTAPGLFEGEEHADAHALLSQLESGKLLLLPPSIDAGIAAAALKQLLLSLAEPLLLNRLADQWVAAAANSAAVKALLAELPVANATTLRVILEACRYLTTLPPSGSATTAAAAPSSSSFSAAAAPTVSAADLAAALAPALLWRVAVARRRSGVPGTLTANLAALRSKISGAVSSVTSGGGASSVPVSPDATAVGRVAPGDREALVSDPEEGTEAAAAVGGGPEPAAEVGSDDVHLDVTSGHATADSMPGATAGTLPTSVFVKSMSVPLGFFSRKSQAPAPVATGAVVTSGDMAEQTTAEEEEEEPGQRVVLTGSDLAAVVAVVQMLIVEGFDLLE